MRSVLRRNRDERPFDRGWLITSLSITTVVALADGLFAQETTLVGLLVLGPLLACARLNAMITATAGGYALLLAIVLGPVNGIWGTPDHLLRVAVLVVGAGLSIYIAHSRTLREEALGAVARVAQEAVLLPLSAEVGGVKVATRYRSASRDVLVGGDLFDVANTGSGVRVLIGDVRGKGLSATLKAAATLRGFRNAAYTEQDLTGVVSRLEAGLSGHLGPEDFVTAVVAEFAPGRVTFVNCGHHSPLLLDGTIAFLAPAEADLPLGLGSAPSPYSTDLTAGQRVLLYTDGLVEARDGAGRMFDLLGQVGELSAMVPSEEVLDELLKRLDAHAEGGVDDDVALVLCEPSEDTDTAIRNRAETAPPK